MRKLISIMTVFLLLLMCFNFSIPINVLADGTSSNAGISYMPPNPEVYPEYYGKGAAGVSTMKSAAVYPMPRVERVSEADGKYSRGEAAEVLVIPISFTDKPFASGQDTAYFDEKLKLVKDYFEYNSQYDSVNKKGMTINISVTDAVYSNHPLAFYGGDGVYPNSIDGGTLYGGDTSDNGDISELAREAILKADKNVDFSKFDKDKDGVVDHIFIIQSGNGQEESKVSTDIWSHSYKISDGQTVDGVKALNYIMMPASGQLGTYAHEFGHDIGLPDLYDANGDSEGETYGVGRWDLMGYGSWNTTSGEPAGYSPANLSAWSRMFMGWVDPAAIGANGSYVLTNTDGRSSVLKFWTMGGGTSEYYLSEYRQKLGYDQGLPGTGLLIWHVDQQLIDTYIDYNRVNSNEERLGVELEQADGERELWWLTSVGDDGDPFPGSSNNMNFTAVPYGFNYSNINTSAFDYVALTNIMTSGSTASADYYVTASYPTAPSILKPANEAVTSVTPVLGWGISPQAEYFDLQVSTDPSFSTISGEYILNEKSDGISYTGNGYEFTIPSGKLSADTLYYWRVAGYNSMSNSSSARWTSTRCFTTVTAYTEGMTAPGVSFSFDGKNAGRLMGITSSMEFSLDGGTNYILAAGDNQLLTNAQLAAITAGNNIRVRLISGAGAVKIIDILTGTTPSVTANNSSNTINGINTSMEFSTDNATWTIYNGSNLPDLSGSITIYVRSAATSYYLPSAAKTLIFTKTTTTSGGGGGGGGGGGVSPGVTTASTNTSIVDAGVTLHETSLLTQINDASKTGIIVEIPADAKEQSVAIDTSAIRKLAAKGKSLTIRSGNVQLVLPAGAIGEVQLSSIGDTSQLKLSINEVGFQQAAGKAGMQQPGGGLTLVGGNLFDFSAELASKDKTLVITGFDASVRITISLKGMSLSGIDTEKLGAYYYNEGTKAWEYLGGRYDQSNGTISFDTRHFSFYSVMQYYKTFTDIAGHWSRSYVEKMASRYIAKGENGSFRPDATISRAEFTALLVRSLELGAPAASTNSSFTDVAADKWYASEIGKAYTAGIASKADGVSFRPDVEITREEIVVMVARALKYGGKGLELSEEQVAQRLGGFSDYEQVAESARGPFAIALEKGIVKGRTADTIAPKGNATRAEAIVMIYRLLNVK